MTTTIETTELLTHSRCDVEYRMIPGCDGYRVGDDGSVWTFRNSEWRKMVPDKNPKTGYLRVVIGRRPNRRRVFVHRLVLEVFVGPCPEGMEASHVLKNDRTNCALSNLMWKTHRENEADKRLHGTRIMGEKHHQSKLSDHQAMDIRDLFERGMSREELTEIFQLDRGSINRLLRGFTWSHIP